MDLLIVTGFSGAGKSSAAAALEDMGYYCVDNMPVPLLPRFLELCRASGGKYEKVAIVTDVRSGEEFEELPAMIKEIRAHSLGCRIVFIEAEIKTIVKRYKETRRRHPLDPEGGSIEQAVERERVLLSALREQADLVIDTTRMNTYQLQMTLLSALTGEEGVKASVTVMSFGFKHGLPQEADFVFDVRFLANPFYVARLRNLTGLDEDVYSYVFSDEAAERFCGNIASLLGGVIPEFLSEGKSNIVVCIGCTGGHHRSVALARRVAELLSSKGYNVMCRHRDIGR